nr:MAG TPA: tail tape measure protein [Caudoviricetes sp.]
MADGTLNFDTKLDSNGFSSGMGKIQGIAQTALGVFTGQMMTKAVEGMAILGKAALDSVASLEQNVGGVQTLFKESADAVIANANNAYKTAGMSANQYMETVTSFSASLLQSVGGDTVKAANAADMAITDMSDNANKMGTSMESIQNAYQGFAKQNYTMLDNLKLGYGGTKEEMQRLLADAQKITGVKYDINNLNDVYSAIHVIQGQLGITGTTAKEAATTIEGSMNSAKAAWDNFLNGSGDAHQLADAVAVAAGNILKNLLQIGARLVSAVPELFVAIAEQIPGLFASLIPTAEESVGNLLSVVADGVSSMLDCLTANFPQIVSALLAQVDYIIEDLKERWPAFMETGIGIVLSILDGIIRNVPSLIAGMANMLADMINKISENLPFFLQKGGELLGKFLLGILQRLPSLLAGIVQIIGAILSAFARVNWAQLGWNIIKGLAMGIGALIGVALSAIGNVISSLVRSVNPNALTEVGGNLIRGLWNGIMNVKNWILGKIKGFVGDVTQGIKDFFGIHSPSRVMAKEIGRWLPPGIVNGFEAAMPRALSSIKSNMQDMVTQMQGAVDENMGAVTVHATAALAGAGGGTVVYNDNHFEQSNTYNTPVATPSETAKAQREAARNFIGGY